MDGKTDENNAMYSQEDLQYAAQFRAEIHKEALGKVRRVCPGVEAVIDRYPIEAYFQEYWDYPGRWYTIVAIPKESGSRAALIDTIAKDTIEYCRGESFAGRQKEFDASQQRTETVAGEERLRCPNDPFYEQIAKYPDCVVDYCIVTGDPQGYRGCESHWQALDLACRRLFADDGEGGGWHWDAGRARGKRIEADEAFSSAYAKDKLNYRKAFLYPPHRSSCSGVDFVKVNAALFPNGTDDLEAYEWTTDWSDYFDDGHEWWGAMCLTLYDKSLDRFVVIMASATD